MVCNINRPRCSWRGRDSVERIERFNILDCWRSFRGGDSCGIRSLRESWSGSRNWSLGRGSCHTVLFGPITNSLHLRGFAYTIRSNPAHVGVAGGSRHHTRDQPDCGRCRWDFGRSRSASSSRDCTGAGRRCTAGGASSGKVLRSVWCSATFRCDYLPTLQCEAALDCAGCYTFRELKV